MGKPARDDLTWDKIVAFIEAHYRKNRTTVSRDIRDILDAVEELIGLPMMRHRFGTGEDYGTWVVPPRWDVREAWLKDARGREIASYRDQVLFVCPYSAPVRRTLSKAELLPHVFSDPKHPDAFAYNWRYAYDARLRLKDWGISLPQATVDELDDGPFDLCIDVEIEDGEMLVGEITLPGQTDDTFLFLADYCHPGQVNDSFSGLAMFMKVMRALSDREDRRFTYRLLILPETIGSAVYITANPDRLRHVRGALFSEMVGAGEHWYVKLTRRGDTYPDLLATESCRAFPGLQTSPFSGLYGNDEIMFDSVKVGIPSLSLQKHPFEEYHTHLDDPSKLDRAELQHACDIVLHMVNVIEKDNVPRFVHPVPFWMTRFDLFSDDVHEPEEFRFKFDIVYRYLDGNRSVLQIADVLDVPFERVYSFVEKMLKEDLVSITDKHPWR